MKSSKGFSLIEVITALAVVSILLPVVGIVFYNLFVIPPDKVARLNLNNELALLSSFLYNDAHIADNFSAGESPYYGNFTWIDYTTGNHYVVSYYATCPNTSDTSCNNQIIRHVTRENFSESSPTPTPTPSSTATPPPTPTPTAVPDIETYTYCTGVSGSNQNKWAWAKAWNNSEWFTSGRPISDSDFFVISNRSEINAYPGDYVALCAADNSSWGNTDTTPPLDYAADSQLYTININQARGNITGLSLTWTGYGGAFTQNTTVKMWDHVGGGHWDTFISLSDPDNKNIDTYVYNVSGGSAKNYVQPADLNVHILVSSDNGDMAPEDTNFGDALYFNGSNSSTVTANCSAAPTNTFTFEAWVKATETHDIDTQATSGTSGESGQHYVFYPTDGGASNAGVGLSVGTNGISVYERGTSYMPPLAVYEGSLGTAWNHIAVVYSSDIAKIYLNGDLVETGSTSTKGTAYAPCAIGGGSYGYFNGTIDEVRVWGIALNQTQIRENMYQEDPTASGTAIYTVVYNSSGTFTPPSGVTSVQVLVVGGGGGGGSSSTVGYCGGGGGAGGLIYNASYPVSSPITVTVGNGGTGGYSANQGTNGVNSSFGTLTAIGGGAGGSAGAEPNQTGDAGGSGGGGGVSDFWTGDADGQPGAGTTGQGKAGGNGYYNLVTAYSAAAGGGGNISLGTNGSDRNGGDGGAGADYSGIFGAVGGASGWFAGGGGGSTGGDAANNPGYGGAGGGGNGSLTGGNGSDGTANTGGGGGGGSNGVTYGGSGGSGIVVVQYTATDATPLKGYWKFNNCASDIGDGIVEDSSTYNNDGTLSSPQPQCVVSLDRELTVYTDYIALTVTSGDGPTPTPTVEPTPTPVPTQVVFTSSTTWTVPSSVTTIDDILVVAGGGGGGSGQDLFNYCGGGGGAGGLIYNASYGAVTPGANITVTVGAGGAGGTGNNAGTNGSNSQFGSITATGGGGGGNTAGKDGGSGGGGGATLLSYSGGSGTAGPPLQGYGGGSSNNSTVSGWGLPDYSYRKTLNISDSASSYCNTGGTITTVGDYTYHTFTSGTFSFIPCMAGNVEVLVVGGGGGGGGVLGSRSLSSGGGGGAGAVIYNASYALTATTYTDVFTSGGTFVVPSDVTSVSVLVVGGGGGGGGTGHQYGSGGGGGAGGLIYNPCLSVTPSESIAITVGGGGNGGAHGANNGANGGQSTFGAYITASGGGGGGASGTAGLNGGSGGGGGVRTGSAWSGGTGTAGQGQNGGTSYRDGTSSHTAAGGGGGNISAGATATSGQGSAGGAGDNYNGIFGAYGGASGWFSGGGGGGAYDTPGAGGSGGGAAGGDGGWPGDNGDSATANTGGGGGGGGGGDGSWFNDYEAAGGNGGSGIVIVKYTSYKITATVGGGGAGGSSGNVGTKGTDSIFGTITATGGGGGGSGGNTYTSVGQNGGSGGGGGARTVDGTNYSGGSGTTGGNNGGNGDGDSMSSHMASGGGGGAGAVGGSASSHTAGNGGAGVNYNSQFPNSGGLGNGYFGGGGGGAHYDDRGEATYGGGWGGSDGGYEVGASGTANTGGGGGGAYSDGTTRNGGVGGSGIVIVKCKTSDFTIPAKTNYQMKLTVSNSSGASSGSTVYLNGSSLSWPNDFRFTKSDGSTQLDFWIESYDANTATVWVEFDSLPVGTTMFYIYYAKESDTGSSNGTNTFIFFDDFSGTLSKWTEEKNPANTNIESGYLNISGGGTSDPYGHSSLGSSATYTGFQDGIIDGKIWLSSTSIAEVAFRGNYAGNTGYKSRMDARTNEGLGHLKPPYTSGSWSDLSCPVCSHTTTLTNGAWKNFSIAVSGSSFNITYDNTQTLVCHDSTYTAAGEISLQNHYGPYTRYDDIRVRKYAATEPTWGTWGTTECSRMLAAGGGGGAGAAGANATSGVGGNGGAGVDYGAYFGTGVGTSGWFAGGGGGGSGWTAGSAGTGGGGAGGKTTNGGAGTANTGGGGGGTTGSSRTGGAGGSGVVIIQYGTPFYTLLTSAGAGGNVTTPAPPGANYLAGTNASIIANASTCYTFVNWTGTGVDADKVDDPNAASTTILMDASYSVQANFALSGATYTLSLTPDPAGGGSPWFEGSSPFTCGTNVSIFADTDEDWTFDEWTPTDGIADPNASDTTVLMTANRSLTAHYTEGAPAEPTPTPIYYLTSMALTRFVTANNFSLNESGGLILASMTACTNTSMGKYIQKQLTIYLMQRPLYLLPEESIWGEDTISTLGTLRFSGTHNSISGNVKVNGTVTVAATAAANDIDGILTCPDISWLPDPPDTVNLSKLDYTELRTQYPNNSMPVLWPAQQYFTTNLSLGIQVLNDSIHEYVFTGDVDLHSVNGVWEDNSSSSQTLKTGIYYSPGTITLADTYTRGQVTFIANRIIINNNDTGGLITPVIMLVPYREELLFWANGSLGSTTTDYDGAILIRGISDWHACVNLEGVLYAPNGEIELAGSGRTGWFGYTEPASIYASSLVGKDLSIGNSVAGSGSYWNFYRY